MWKIILTYLILDLLKSYAVNMDKVAPAIFSFSSKFCYELESSKSVVASPLSAEVLLALLTLGSEEPSHSELTIALQFPDDKSIRNAFQTIVSKLRSIKGVTLNIANKIYIKNGDYKLNPKLKDDAVKVFDAEFEQIDFYDGNAAASNINKWVSRKTNDRIKDLLKDGDISVETRLILVNALYFKGTWAKQFPKQNTLTLPFKVTNNTIVQVAMMHQENNFRYGESEELGAQLLELPYEGGQASMLIVLPNETEGLSSVLGKLAQGYNLIEDLGRMASVKVQVSIPKFKIETEIDLNVILPKLGIQSIFNSTNSGITGLLNTNEELYVSKAVQKAFIEVNEEGAEAAAATAVSVRKRRAIAEEARVFRADRPALWCIMESQNPLFYAIYRPDGTIARDEL